MADVHGTRPELVAFIGEQAAKIAALRGALLVAINYIDPTTDPSPILAGSMCAELRKILKSTADGQQAGE